MIVVYDQTNNCPAILWREQVTGDELTRPEMEPIDLPHTRQTREPLQQQRRFNIKGFDFIFGVLTPLSVIFQLYHGDQF